VKRSLSSVVTLALVASCHPSPVAHKPTGEPQQVVASPDVKPAVRAPVEPPFEFTAFELDLIRNSLGALPETPPADPSNRVSMSPAAAVLGQRFFFDKQFSADGSTSCATCHDPKTGFQDARANVSKALGKGTRHTPTCINAAFGAGDGTVWQFWDGRSDSLWAQALGPPENDVEMGGHRTAIAYAIYDHYRPEYEALFGAMPALRDASGKARHPDNARPGDKLWKLMLRADQTMFSTIYANWGKTVAAYEAKLISRNSRFDQFWAAIDRGANDSPILTYQEKLGLRVFVGKGGCVACHDGATFTDWQFHNVGVAQTGPDIPAEDTGREGGIETVKASEFSCGGAFSDHPNKRECETATLTRLPVMRGAFKTPGLRDITKTAPYMHTGTFKTLEEVVELYDKGGDGKGFVGTLDQKIGKLGLTAEEKTALVAFMRTLDGAPLDPVLLRAP